MLFALAPFLLQIAIGIGTQIVGYLIAGGPKKSKPEAVQDMDGPTVDAGTPIKVVFGETTVEVQILFYGDKSTHTYQTRA